MHTTQAAAQGNSTNNRIALEHHFIGRETTSPVPLAHNNHHDDDELSNDATEAILNIGSLSISHQPPKRTCGELNNVDRLCAALFLCQGGGF
jgi:hypothetical protein